MSLSDTLLGDFGVLQVEVLQLLQPFEMLDSRVGDFGVAEKEGLETCELLEVHKPGVRTGQPSHASTPVHHMADEALGDGRRRIAIDYWTCKTGDARNLSARRSRCRTGKQIP